MLKLTTQDQTTSTLPFIKEGFIKITPAQANAIYDRCAYKRNRNVNQARPHISALAREMKAGAWLEKSPIDFARLPNGRLTMVNGHHRMLAQVEAGKDIVWNFAIHDVQSEQELADLFWRFDTTLRKRTMQNVLNGVAAADAFGLSKETTVALSRAATFINNGMASPQASKRHYTAREKLTLMEEWQEEALIYDDILKLAPRFLSRKLRGAQIMAVALVTINAADDAKAIEFWRGVAADDGLHRGDPRKCLIDFIRDTHASGTSTTGTAVACARAWNAWEQGRQLNIMRIGKTAVRIAGTKKTVSP